MYKKTARTLALFLTLSQVYLHSGINQTDDLTPILPPTSLPFNISIELADFSLPNGIHSGVSAIYNNKWLFLSGRTNGLHGFSNTNDNFPPQQQNTTVYVVDPINQTVVTRSLLDPQSGLTQHQVDLLSVTSPQYDQQGTTLYITGGYGVDTATGQFSTKDTLTAIDIPGLMSWVTNPSPKTTAAQYIRQISHPLVQVTGGVMYQANRHSPTLLIFGQNFAGFYNGTSNGDYTQQVRAFRIIDNGKDLFIQPKKTKDPNPNYRRRDLNVVPVIKKKGTKLEQDYVALSGVFTLDVGVWTVPVEISADGDTFMADPSSPTTFKQGMNNYTTANVGLYSLKTGDMYTVLMGGISFGFFKDGVFDTNNGIPFINQITTIQIDKDGVYSQYLMDNEYPVIPSNFANPGKPLQFGAGSIFMPAPHLPKYPNEVLQLDELGSSPLIIGYIVGGIQSSQHNTTSRADSAASPYIFQVLLEPQN